MKPSGESENNIGDEDGEDDEFVPGLPTTRTRTKERSKRIAASTALNGSMIRDADDFLNEVEVENNLKWKEYAALIDDVSRFWFPCIYFVACSIILAKAKS
jgi:hypothetical protein